MDGLEATSRIVEEADWGVRVLILTTFDPDEYMYRALPVGASGFVLKDIPPAELASAVRTVADGGALLAPSITRRLIGQFAERLAVDTAVSGRLERLTERERDVLTEIASGSSNAEFCKRPLYRCCHSEVARIEHSHQAWIARPSSDRGLRLREWADPGGRPRYRTLGRHPERDPRRHVCRALATERADQTSVGGTHRHRQLSGGLDFQCWSCADRHASIGSRSLYPHSYPQASRNPP